MLAPQYSLACFFLFFFPRSLSQMSRAHAFSNCVLDWAVLFYWCKAHAKHLSHLDFGSDEMRSIVPCAAMMCYVAMFFLFVSFRLKWKNTFIHSTFFFQCRNIGWLARGITTHISSILMCVWWVSLTELHVFIHRRVASSAICSFHFVDSACEQLYVADAIRF